MRGYLVRRILLIIPTIFIVTMLVFLISRFIPGNVIDMAEVGGMIGIEGLTAQARQLKQEGNPQLGLHIIDFVIRGTEDIAIRKEAMLLKAELLDDKARVEPSMIARHILQSGATITREQGESLQSTG